VMDQGMVGALVRTIDRLQVSEALASGWSPA
jgi:hypothetical protein